MLTQTKILKNFRHVLHIGHAVKQFIFDYAYKTMSREDRNNILREIIKDQMNDTIRDIVRIGYNLDAETYTYSIIAGTPDTVFFDSLYID